MRFLKKYPDLPGALVMIFVAWFQIVLKSNSANEIQIGYNIALENQVLDFCRRIAHLEIATGQNKSGNCDEFPYAPISQRPGHFTWPQIDAFLSHVEFYVFLIGLIMFLAGLTYRFVKDD